MKTGETTSIYQIFVRNFTEEGTFRAAIPRLGQIRAMGFDWLYLAPIHPIGEAGRKGSAGSPYAISDYRKIHPELGTEEDFSAFLAAAHGLGLKVMIDVVYNHSSPDARLWHEHPDWYLRDPADPNLASRKCADWSDVIDFDFSSSPHLWIELIDTLAMWRDRGVDGFRCDVASLVPVEFWRQARQKLNQYDPGTKADTHPLLWLAESVHPSFLASMRKRGFGAWSEPELHAAFDLTYDYDGWERLEQVWKARRPVQFYIDYLYAQETLYPASARKIRYLENHDQDRAAHRFPDRASLEAWTIFMQFLPGNFFAYMGQEFAIAHKPNLFEKDPVDWNSGDSRFREFFVRALGVANSVKSRASHFSGAEIAPGIVLLRRWGGALEWAEASPRYAALLDVRDGATRRTVSVELPHALRGKDLLSGASVSLAGRILPPRNPLVIDMVS